MTAEDISDLKKIRNKLYRKELICRKFIKDNITYTQGKNCGESIGLRIAIHELDKLIKGSK